jgi:hypothetical protein
MIAFPNDEDRLEVNQHLRLDAGASELLWRGVAQLLNDINRHEASQAEMAQGRNRKERLRYIKTLSSLLTKLEIQLADRDPNTGSVLRRELG